MAIIQLSGTKLAPRKAKVPLNRKFMIAIGCVFLIAMHIYIPNVGGSGITLPFNAAIWITLSFAIAIALYHIAATRKIRYSKLSIFLLICCVLLTLPIFYPLNNGWINTLPRLIALWSGWLFFFTLQQFRLSNQHKQRLLWFIVIASIIQVILGYLQLFNLLPKDLLGYNSFTLFPFGVFQNPSVMASFLSTGLVISGYLLARQQQKYGQKLSRTLFLYLVPLVTAPLIVLLAQKFEWLGTAIGFVCIATYLYRFSTPQRLSGWVSLSVAGVGFGLILFSALGNEIQHPQNQQTDKTFLFPQALDMLIEKPFTGYGYGRFEPEYILYTARQHQLNPQYSSGSPSLEHPLNELLYWGIEGGIIPIIGILLAAIMVLFKIYSARKGTRLAIFSLFIPIISHSQIGMPFYLSAVHWLIFIILLYWVDQRTSSYKTYSISKISKIAVRNTAFIVPIVTTVFMLLALQANIVLYKYEQSYPKKTKILTQAINPIFRKLDFDWVQYRDSLRLGLMTNNRELVEQYVSWSLKAIKQHPRELYYSNLIMAYLGLGEISKANQIRTEASFLFPNYDFSMIYIEPMILPITIIQDIEAAFISDDDTLANNKP